MYGVQQIGTFDWLCENIYIQVMYVKVFLRVPI